MIHIVTGHARSGTTMAMKILEACGARKLIVSGERNDFMETSQEVLKEFFYDPNEFDNTSIKIIGIKRLLNLRPLKSGYRIIFMKRNPYEINASFEKMTGWNPMLGNPSITEMTKTAEILLLRNDVQLVTLDYRKIVENPKLGLEPLNKLGIIPNEKAWAIPQDKECHWKFEDMDIRGPWKSVRES